MARKKPNNTKEDSQRGNEIELISGLRVLLIKVSSKRIVMRTGDGECRIKVFLTMFKGLSLPM